MSQGIQGFIDFTGLFLGEGSSSPVNINPIGYCGIVDWTFLCAGGGMGAPSRGGHGFRGAGKPHAFLLYMLMIERWMVRARVRPSLDPISDIIAQRVSILELDVRADQARSVAESAAYSLLLSEI